MFCVLRISILCLLLVCLSSYSSEDREGVWAGKVMDKLTDLLHKE